MSETPTAARTVPELWFRPLGWYGIAALGADIRNRTITATPRLGTRDASHPKGYRVGAVAQLRIFDADGAEATELRAEVTITALTVKPVCEIRTDDLTGCGRLFERRHPQALAETLGCYASRRIGRNEPVTIVRFSYGTERREQPMTSGTPETIAQLLDAGVIQPARKPPRNDADLHRLQRATVPLLAHDYPAKTAAMWNAVYDLMRVEDRNVMVVAEPVDAARILAAFRADPTYEGGGAGIGFKEVVAPLLDELTPRAQAVGAVNIIRKVAGKLAGDNTDGLGLAIALEYHFAEHGRRLGDTRLLLLGAGATARSIAFALAERGAMTIIANRTPERAIVLADDLNRHVDRPAATGVGRNKLDDFLPFADAVIAAVDSATSPIDAYSPLGEMPDAVTPEAIAANLGESAARLTKIAPRNGRIVVDIRIREGELPLLRQAREQGFAAMDGIPMVVNQAVEAFWWLYGGELALRDHPTKDEIAGIMRNAARPT